LKRGFGHGVAVRSSATTKKSGKKPHPGLGGNRGMPYIPPAEGENQAFHQLT
jgi:hypothetical protein